MTGLLQAVCIRIDLFEHFNWSNLAGRKLVVFTGYKAVLRKHNPHEVPTSNSKERRCKSACVLYLVLASESRCYVVLWIDFSWSIKSMARKSYAREGGAARRSRVPRGTRPKTTLNRQNTELRLIAELWVSSAWLSLVSHERILSPTRQRKRLPNEWYNLRLTVHYGW